MKRFTTFLMAALLSLSILLAACAPSEAAPTEAPAGQPSAESEPVTFKVAVLPIVDALPMYVADQEGLFANYGVAVEFVPVASAPERDQLLAAGQVDGTINETLSTIFFNKEEVQIQILRYAFVPTPENAHFFILASGKSGIDAPEGLKGVEIGVSQGTVIEYVTDRLLQAEGFTDDEIATIAVPKIPDRMALLGSGELQAAVLPDPLASLAIQQGAVIAMDDSQYPEYGFSVLSFRKDVIDAHPEALRGFLAAVEEATALINADPAKYASVLSDKKLVPPPLLETYNVPTFPTAGVPTEAEWNDALAWAQEKGLIETDVPYAGSVNADFLP
ncbi:MAG: ABC transporter substrate-binding protein [Chloroflexi bacterium]|nr:ABC transporter substrate-binding protein [Chloroflexota bacterium]